MSPAVGSWNIKDVTTVRFIASETVALNVFSCDKPTRGRVWTVTGTTETGLCFFPISLLGKRHAWLFSLVSSATQKSLWSWTDSTRHPDRGWIPIWISLFHFFILLIYLSSLYPTHPTFFCCFSFFAASANSCLSDAGEIKPSRCDLKKLEFSHRSEEECSTFVVPVRDVYIFPCIFSFVAAVLLFALKNLTAACLETC